MFHLYFDSSVEKLTDARNQIAERDKIWTANSFRETPLENLSYTEIYVGEGLLKISDREIKDTFERLVRLAK